MAFAPHDQRARVPMTWTNSRSKRERFDEQAHVPCSLSLSAEPAHAPGSTSSKDKRALAPGSSSSNQMWSLPPTMVVLAALAFGVPMTSTSPWSKRERFDEQAHVPWLSSSSAAPAHAPGSTSSKGKQALAPGSSSSNQMWLFPLAMVVLALLAFGVPMTRTPPVDQRGGVGEWAHATNLPSSWDELVYAPVLWSSWNEQAFVLCSSESSHWDVLGPTAHKHLPKALCSPHVKAVGGSRTKTTFNEVSMSSSSNTTILLLSLALIGMPGSMMAMLMAWMPMPFDGAGPSRGGREGIAKSEENNLHHNLGSNLNVVTPFLRIPLYSWYRNLM